MLSRFCLQDDAAQRQAQPARPWPPDSDMAVGTTGALYYQYAFMFAAMFAEYEYAAFFEDDLQVRSWTATRANS